MMKILTIAFLLVCTLSSQAQLKLANVFGDNMVVQRDQALKIWGQASPKESVTVDFNGQTVSSKADKSGKWKVELKPMTHGGPFAMTVSGNKEKLQLKNILIGDVWIGSGQSNMEWPLFNTKKGAESIENSANSRIRLFTVEKDMAANPESDITTTGWHVSSPESSPNFSAVAYHFGKQINKDLFFLI